jgi:SAM-dependent methyltransferase
MDLATLDTLLTPAGAAALAAAADLSPTDASYPPCFDRLAKRFPPPLTRAALDTVMLRRRAAAKFAGAERMVFDREALEMASGDLVAGYRATRYRHFRRVADLGCGIGGDALALTAAGLDVVCVDRDPVRLRMCEANLAAHGRTARFICGDLLTASLEGAEAAFADPGRRPGGERVLAPEACEPPVSAIVGRFPPSFPLGIKVAPGIARTDLLPYGPDVEFISAHGELKECVLWFGGLRLGKPAATLLPGPHTLTGDPGDPFDVAPVEPGHTLYDPDPAVVRADLMGELARNLSAWPLEAGYALLAAADHTPTPFAIGYRIEAVLPLDARTVGRYLRERGIGRLTVLKRGVEVDADALGRKWRTGQGEHRTVILCRAGGKRVALVCQAVP